MLKYFPTIGKSNIISYLCVIEIGDESFTTSKKIGKLIKKYTNTETNLQVNGGPHILRGVDIVAGGLQRSASPQILSVGVSSQYFDVDFIKESDSKHLRLFSLLYRLKKIMEGLSSDFYVIQENPK